VAVAARRVVSTWIQKNNLTTHSKGGEWVDHSTAHHRHHSAPLTKE
jgi:hypothetical protein